MQTLGYDRASEPVTTFFNKYIAWKIVDGWGVRRGQACGLKETSEKKVKMLLNTV